MHPVPREAHVTLDPRTLLLALVIGAVATAGIDLWALVLKRGFRIASLNYCLLGRWVLHLPGGTLVHRSIGAAAPKAGECATGWAAHYAIGVGLAVIFVLLVSAEWLAAPTLLPALAFGVATVVMPLFVLQPALGLGVASSRAPSPWAARLKSVGTHTVFGLGLYLAAEVLRRLGLTA